MNRVFVFLFIICCFSCKKENLGDCFKSTGKTSIEERFIPTFRSIELNDKIDLFVEYGPNLNLRVKAGENLQKLIKTEVKNGQLIIENDNKCNWVRSFKKRIEVYLQTPTLKAITYYGSGRVNFTNTFVSDTLLVNLWEASGDLTFKIDANYVELKSHTGTGTIKCEGNTEGLVTFMGGNGFIETEQTTAKNVLAVNNNTGYLRIKAEENLKADISGAGNIEYFGNPVIELIDIGEGELIKR